MNCKRVQFLEILVNILLSLSLYFNSKLISSLFSIHFDLKYLFYFILCVSLAYAIKYNNNIKLEFYTDQKRLELYKKIITQWDTTLVNSSADLLNRDLVKCIEYINVHLPQLITDISTVLVGILIITRTSRLFALILIIFSLVQIILPLKMSKQFQINYKLASKIEDDINLIYCTSIRGFSKLHFFDSNYMLNRIYPLYYDYYLVGSKSEKTATIYGACKDFLSIMGRFGLCFCSLIICYYTKVNVADMIASVYLGGKISDMILNVFKFMQNRSEYIISYERISHYYLQNDYNSITVKKSIILQDILLPYNDQKVTMNIHIGDKILIRGKNGSGKSSILRIILGLINPKEGKIYIDNHIYSQYFLDCFYIPQFNGSLDMSLEELRQYYGVHNIESENKNLDELSSGQYRFSLLKIAFHSNQRCIVLDEPEDNLDEIYKNELLEMITNYEGLLIIASNENYYDKLCNKVVNLNE